jgi:IS30 family transposase
MPQVPPLTDAQRREIVRLRAMGRQIKVIARSVGCTPCQVRRWLRVHRDKGAAERRYSRKSRRIVRGVQARLADKSSVATREEEAEICRRVLAAEVAEARAERNTAPLLKKWPEGTFAKGG